jgi:uncharacterized protein (UPF0335 family)
MENKDTRLVEFLQRIQRVQGEIKELQADVREIYAEAKGEGYDPKVMKQIIRLYEMTSHDRAENEFLRQQYKQLVGIEE